jgi:hypothetical protein
MVGEFGMEDVYIPADESAEDEVSAFNDSEKLVEKYMEYAAKETKVQVSYNFRCIGLMFCLAIQRVHWQANLNGFFLEFTSQTCMS